jgi:hypothetical protein
METIKRSELTNLRMVAGNERKYDNVIIDGVLKNWVGIGWVEIRTATPADKRKYPTLED